MLELLYKLFIGHRHVYEVQEQINIMNSSSQSNIPKAKCYILQCKVCGKMKEFRVKG